MTQIKQLDIVLNTASASIGYNNIIANSEQVKLGVNLLGTGVSYPAVPGLYKSGKSTVSVASVVELLKNFGRTNYSDSLALSYVLLNSTKGLGTQYAAASNVVQHPNKATLISASANSTLSKSPNTAHSSTSIATTSLVKSAENASVSSALTQFALTKLIDKLLNSSYTSSVLVNFLLNNTYASSSQVQDNILNLVSIVKSSNATLASTLQKVIDTYYLSQTSTSTTISESVSKSIASTATPTDDVLGEAVPGDDQTTEVFKVTASLVPVNTTLSFANNSLLNTNYSAGSLAALSASTLLNSFVSTIVTITFDLGFEKNVSSEYFATSDIAFKAVSRSNTSNIEQISTAYVDASVLKITSYLAQSLVGLEPVLIKSSFVGSDTAAIKQVNQVTNSVQLTSTILSKAASAIHSSPYLVLSQPLLGTEKLFSSASQTKHLVVKQPNKFSNSNAQPATVLFKGTSTLNSSLPASQDSSELFFSKLSTTTLVVAEQGSATTQNYFETPASYLSTGDYVGTSYTI